MALPSAPTLQRLRARLLAADLRSRSIRLTRFTRSGAHDVAEIAALAPTPTANLLRQFGQEQAKPVRWLPTHGTDSRVNDRVAALTALNRANHARWLETGADDLALGWPLLEARGPDGTWVRGPLLLAPLTLGKEDGHPSLLATVAGPVEINEPLVKVLSRTFGAAFTLETLLDGDDDRVLAIDPPTFANLVTTLAACGLPLEDASGDERAVNGDEPAALPGLEEIGVRDRAARDAFPIATVRVTHAAVAGRFPRGGSQLVGDYDAMLAASSEEELGLCREVLRNFARGDDSGPPDSTLGRGPSAATEREFEDSTSDAVGARRWQVLASDKSQDAVFRALFPRGGDEHGSSPDTSDSSALGLVVQGPPGTGKSQLLANVLATAIGSGRTTLVVCQKRAALDVVAQRLADVGLGDACVVVHDTSRDRADVAHRIATRLSPLLEDTPDAVAQDRQDLGAHTRAANALSARLSASQNAFEAFTREQGDRPSLLALLEDKLDDDGRDLPDLERFASELTEADALAAGVRADALAKSAAAFAAPHPLFWRRSFAGLDAPAMDARFSRVAAAHRAAHNFDRNEHKSNAAPSFESLFAAARAFDEAEPALSSLSLDAPPALAAQGNHLRLFWAWTGGRDEGGAWSQVMQRLRQAQQDLLDTPRELVAGLTASLAQWRTDLEAGEEIEARWNRFFSPAHWRSRKAIKEVEALTHSDPVSREKTLALIVQAQAWQELLSDLPDDNRFLELGFTGQTSELDDALVQLARDHDRVAALHQLSDAFETVAPELPRIDLDNINDRGLDAVLDARERLRAYSTLDRALDACTPDLDPFELDTFRTDATRGDVKDLAVALFEFGNVDAKTRDAVRRLDEEMQHDPAFLVAFLRRTIPRDNAARDLDRAVRRAWTMIGLGGRDEAMLEAPLVDEGALRGLFGAREQCRLAAAPAAAASIRLRVRELARTRPGGAALRRLLAQARKKRRRLSLRGLVDQGRDAGLLTLVPVWLCSPDAVAHLFDATPGSFDLVIFDEASQCPVEAGLPALWRGKRALIAGDDQQMPPSHFFESRDDEEEEGDEVDDVVQSPSLLALARVAFPSRSLAYHYRSRDERLIAFSNTAYYGGGLTTAPRVTLTHADDHIGFGWREVAGVWHQQRNLVEAEAIVDEIALALSRSPPPSVGVVCMNRPQTELVEERLEARANVDTSLAANLARDRVRPPIEQLFVRNLENVQGDERDCIVFSIGYGPKEVGGKTRAHFGPLGQMGGEKRLNVAITRAKERIVVVTSFAPESLDVTKAAHAGPRLFHAWLRYARACAQGIDTGALLAEAGELGGTQPAAPSRPEHRARHGARLFLDIERAFSEANAPWSAQGGLGRERIDFVCGSTALDVTSLWRESDAIARDITGPAFWRRAGFEVTRVTPRRWREDQSQWLGPKRASATE